MKILLEMLILILELKENVILIPTVCKYIRNLCTNLHKHFNYICTKLKIIFVVLKSQDFNYNIIYFVFPIILKLK